MITAHKGVSERIYKSHLLASSSSCSILSHRGLLSCGPSCRALLAKVVGGKNYQYKAKLEWIREELEDGGIALCRRLINGDKAADPSGYPFSLMTRQPPPLLLLLPLLTAGAAMEKICCVAKAWWLPGNESPSHWFLLSLIVKVGKIYFSMFSNNEVFSGCHQSP